MTDDLIARLSKSAMWLQADGSTGYAIEMREAIATIEQQQASLRTARADALEEAIAACALVKVAVDVHGSFLQRNPELARDDCIAAIRKIAP
jgi:hypothetical protein